MFMWVCDRFSPSNFYLGIAVGWRRQHWNLICFRADSFVSDSNLRFCSNTSRPPIDLNLVDRCGFFRLLFASYLVWLCWWRFVRLFFGRVPFGPGLWRSLRRKLLNNRFGRSLDFGMDFVGTCCSWEIDCCANRVESFPSSTDKLHLLKEWKRNQERRPDSCYPHASWALLFYLKTTPKSCIIKMKRCDWQYYIEDFRKNLFDWKFINSYKKTKQYKHSNVSIYLYSSFCESSLLS